MKKEKPCNRFVCTLSADNCLQGFSSPPQDTSRVNELNDKAWKLRNEALEISKRTADTAILLAHRLNFMNGLAKSYNVLGFYFKEKGLSDSCIYYYTQSLRLREQLRDTFNIARSYRNLLNAYGTKGDNSKAIECGIKSMQLLSKYPDREDWRKEKADAATGLAGIYRNTGDYEKAISLTLEARQIFIAQGEEYDRGLTNITLGNIYEEQKFYPKAIVEFESAVRIFEELKEYNQLGNAFNDFGSVYYNMGNFKTALFYYRKSLAIRVEEGFEDEIKGTLMNIGIVYEDTKQKDSAIYYYTRALEISLRSGNLEGQYESYRTLGVYLYNQKDYKKAKSHLLNSERLSRSANVPSERVAILGAIAKNYKALGNSDSALYYVNQLIDLNDWLHDKLMKAAELEDSLKTKDYELKAEKSSLAISFERQRHQTMVIIGMSVGMVLLVIIFFLYYRYVRSKRNAQQLRALVKDKELQALDAMLEGQQEERKRLAVELHDTIGSMLSATKYSFKAMEKSLEKMVEENKVQYRKINVMLDETMDSVRKISHEMVAGVSAEKGLEESIVELCRMFEQPDKLQIHVGIFGLDKRLDGTVEMHLYRIVQELLANILKHAHAREVTVQLLRSPGNLNLMVEDNGRGFDPAESRKKKGIGISNIEQRVQKLGGTWSIDSGKGRGTTVIIDIPINEETV